MNFGHQVKGLIQPLVDALQDKWIQDIPVRTCWCVWFKRIELGWVQSGSVQIVLVHPTWSNQLCKSSFCWGPWIHNLNKAPTHPDCLWACRTHFLAFDYFYFHDGPIVGYKIIRYVRGGATHFAGHGLEFVYTWIQKEIQRRMCENVLQNVRWF